MLKPESIKIPDELYNDLRSDSFRYNIPINDWINIILFPRLSTQVQQKMIIQIIGLGETTGQVKAQRHTCSSKSAVAAG